LKKTIIIFGGVSEIPFKQVLTHIQTIKLTYDLKELRRAAAVFSY